MASGITDEMSKLVPEPETVRNIARVASTIRRTLKEECPGDSIFVVSCALILIQSEVIEEAEKIAEGRNASET